MKKKKQHDKFLTFYFCSASTFIAIIEFSNRRRTRKNVLLPPFFSSSGMLRVCFPASKLVWRTAPYWWAMKPRGNFDKFYLHILLFSIHRWSKQWENMVPFKEEEVRILLRNGKMQLEEFFRIGGISS